MKKAILVNIGEPVRLIDCPEKTDWEWLRDAIGVDWIEIVRPRGLPGYRIVIDEEGRMKDSGLNVPASWYYGTKVHGEFIVGNALFLKEVNTPDGGELVGLDEEEAQNLYQEIVSNYSDRYDEVLAAMKAHGFRFTFEIVGLN